MILRYAIVAAWLVGTAHAKDATEVVVVGVHVDGLASDAATAATAALVRQIDKQTGFNAVGPVEAQARIRGRGSRIVDDVLLSRGRALLAEGQVLFQHADLEAAVLRITEAVDAFDDAMVGSTDTLDFQEALLVQGMIHQSMGAVDAARVSFGRVIQMDAARELNALNYPPKVVTLFEDVRDEILESPAGAIDLRLNLPDADVYVDGQHRGIGSMVVRDVVPGSHHVLVMTASGLRSHARVEVSSMERAVIAIDPPRRFIGLPDDSPTLRSGQIATLYRAVGDQVTDGLILLGGQIDATRVGLQVYEPRSGKFSEIIEGSTGPIPASSLVSLSEYLAEFQTMDGGLATEQMGTDVLPLDISSNPVLSRVLLDKTGREAAPPPVASAKPASNVWMIWTGVGVGVVGATVAVILLTGSKAGNGTPAPKPTGTVVVAF